MNAPRGPVDSVAWPEKLRAHVVDEAPFRIHGYEVDEDLAIHYRFAAVTYLSLTGELPTEGVERIFEHALVLLSPSPVSEPPAHAAVLARTCEGNASAVIATGALALAEQARFEVARHRPFREWLDTPQARVPSEFRATGDERGLCRRLSRALAENGVSIPFLDEDLTRLATVFALLHQCGIRRAEQLETLMVLARLPVALAEAFAVTPASFREYPLNLPTVDYEER